MKFDELNIITKRLAENIQATFSERTNDEIIDEIEDLLILSYMGGSEETLIELDITGDDIDGEKPNIGYNADTEKLNDALRKEYDGETYKDKANDYLNEGNLSDLERLIDTEAHRLYVAGQFDTAPSTAYKQWVTKLDNRVRDTHDYLEGDAVPLDEKFYTFDGDSARYPGDFELASNNVNCRCILKLSWR